jgi:hypothetical protein
MHRIACFALQLLALRLAVEHVVHDMLVSPAPEPRLALLRHLRPLAQFVGRRDAADVLLPPLLTLYNCRHWQVGCWSSWRLAAPCKQEECAAAALLSQHSTGDARLTFALQVRAAFFENFAGVCTSLGPDGTAAIVLPFLDRMVSDPDDTGERAV